jgi:membrane protein implicated in regulation of membrane protease activity
MKRPAPIRDPSYNLPSASSDENATPAEKALGALKTGAIAALVVTIVLIYVTSYGGLKGRRELASLLVVVAFLLPSVVAYLLAWRAHRRRPREPDDSPRNR